MKIPLKTLDLRPQKGHVVGCGIQGTDCLAIDVSSGKGGKWSVNWSLAGNLEDATFGARLSKMTGSRHFWVSPSEEGGLQIETARTIEIPEGDLAKKNALEGFFLTQVKSRFVNETIVFGGMRMKGASIKGGVSKKCVHNVGGGAIRDNVQRDYRNWYSMMHIRRPHVASSALALANAYLALYPTEKRQANPLRLVVLMGRSVYRAILMDDWKYVDEVLLPRMEGDVIENRVNGWIEYFLEQHPEYVQDCRIVPLVISVGEEMVVSDYEQWDMWGEHAMEKIDMSADVAETILANRDIAPVAFGMALQGGC